MEIIIFIGLLAVVVVWYFMRETSTKTTSVEVAPYKVDVPPVVDPAPVVETKVEEPAPVVAETPAVFEPTPVKKTRKPRAPKAEKPVAKKAATKKAAAMSTKKPRSKKA